MKFWRLPPFQKSAVLVGASLAGLGLSFVLRYVAKGHLTLDSPTHIINAMLMPMFVLTLGCGGYVTDSKIATKLNLLKVWSFFSAYLVLLSAVIYFGLVPIDWPLFIMPLTTALVTLPLCLWLQARLNRVIDSQNE